MSDSQSSDTSPRARSLATGLKISIMGLLFFLGTLAYFNSHLLTDHNGFHQNATKVSQNKEERKVIPPFEIRNQEKEMIPFHSLKGKVQIVSFWAGWCYPCIEELPGLTALYEKFKSQGFDIIAINTESEQIKDEEKLKPWVEYKVPYPSYFDAKEEAIKAMGVEILPANFLIDKDQKIVAAMSGYVDWESSEIQEMISTLLKE